LLLLPTAKTLKDHSKDPVALKALEFPVIRDTPPRTLKDAEPLKLKGMDLSLNCIPGLSGGEA
jgi:hypothetical protein